MKEVIFIVEFVLVGREVLSPFFFYSKSDAEDYADKCKKENSKILAFNILHFVRL